MIAVTFGEKISEPSEFQQADDDRNGHKPYIIVLPNDTIYRNCQYVFRRPVILSLLLPHGGADGELAKKRVCILGFVQYFLSSAYMTNGKGKHFSNACPPCLKLINLRVRVAV